MDIRKYTSTYMVNSPVAPWIINPECVDRLQMNAAFIEQQKSIYTKKLDSWHIRNFMNGLKAFDTNSRAELHHFGMKTNQYSEGGKLKREEFEKLFSTSDFALCAERFFAPDFMCQGSSRHALLYDVQLKGVGTNHLNFNQDYHHRWGGFLTRDALRAVFNNEILNARTPLGASEILGLFLYQEKTFQHIQECIQVRDATSYRLAQLFPGSTVPEDRKVAKDFLKKRFNGADSQSMMKTILHHYLMAFRNGVQYRSISYDNLLLDGVFTDSESVDFTLDKSQAPQFIKIFVPKNIDVKKESLAFYLGEYDCYFYSSWFHDLRLMYEMNAFIFDDIFQTSHFDSELFRTTVKTLIQQPQYAKLDQYSSYRETELLPHRQHELQLLKAQELEAFMDYNLIDYYTQTYLEGTVLVFCHGREADLRLDTVQALNKLEVLLYSEFEKLNLEKSFENFQILKKSVSKYV